MKKVLKGRMPSPQCIAAKIKVNQERLRDPKVQAVMQAGLREYYKTHPGPWKDAYGSKNPNWRGGIAFEPYSAEFDNELRKIIRMRDNHQCQLCSISAEEHWLKHFSLLPVHHINYNKLDQRMSNLITLCKKCHGKTNGNRFYYEQLFTKIQEGVTSLPAWEQLRLL